ncbi:MAG: GFA family protein [Qipengyuania sp.]
MRSKRYACHCTDCQKRTGSAFSCHMRVMKVDLDVSGETDEGQFSHPSGMQSRIVGCARCRSRIYATSDVYPDAISLRWGTLDKASTLSPEAHIWVRSKQPWIAIPDGVPALDTQPKDDAGWAKVLVSK